MTFALNKFVLFGDSITEFAFNLKPLLEEYPDQSTQFALGSALAQDYLRKLDIVHRGYSGYNTRLAKQITPTLLKYDHDSQPDALKIKLLYLFFGTNDAAVGSWASVPLDEYKLNVTAVIEEFKKRDIKLILVAPLQHDAPVWEGLDKYIPENGRRTTERNEKYGLVLEELAQKFELGFVNLVEEFKNYAGKVGKSPESLLVDGVHFTGEGYKAFYDGLKKEIKRKYPELDSEALEQNLLPYGEALTNGVESVLE